jgi:cyclophilin family peptidyl-prolyl cis-trans isomerase/HEAT repeat protein
MNQRALRIVLGVALFVACRESPSSGPASSSASASATSRAPVPPSALLQAELRRDRSAVSEDDLTSESSTRRAAAVRALARIQDELSFEPLAKALADQDVAVLSWAALGVGQLCRGREPEAVRRLVVRAASLAAEAPTPGRHEALGALALALGRCASDEAERTLRAWLRLEPALASSAALALGRVARERRHLDDATIAALLDAAAQRPDEGAFFFAIESLPSLGPAARERLREVADKAFERPGPARAFAARALAKAGPAAAPTLRRLIDAPATSDVERANAASSLAALGPDAQQELAAALTGRARALIDGNAWLTSQHGVVLTLLDGLESPSPDAKTLLKLSQLALDTDPSPVRRRKIMLRCRAAAVLAGRASLSRALLGCDPSAPTERREGSLALLRVLGRGSLAKGRGARFQELARSEDRVVREAALELLMSHDEAHDIPALLAAALDAKEAGVRATAAKVLARYPARAQLTSDRAATAPTSAATDPRVVQALTKQLAEVGRGHHIELSSLLLDAAAALELLGVKPALERACASTNPTLRSRAERAYAALGEPQRRCPTVAERAALFAGAVPDFRVDFETDVGPLGLTLSGTTSPFATTRLVELVRSGFFDGMLVHRAVPGFVVQLGDPDGDGFGGPSLPPLRCQIGLEPFDVGSVGIALAGRDTGLSQFFVALRRAPHLDGEYSLIGHADPGWERLAPGDRVLRARVLEGSGK